MSEEGSEADETVYAVVPREPWALSLPAIPDDAPEEIKDRLSRTFAALLDSQCPECLERTYASWVGDPSEGRFAVHMDHLPTCPLHLDRIKRLAAVLRYSLRIFE